MNDVQHFEAARALAERMLTEGGATPAERIAFAYRTVLSRKPEPEEWRSCRSSFAAHLDRYEKDEAGGEEADRARRIQAEGRICRRRSWRRTRWSPT